MPQAEWLAARKELLSKEKEFTRLRDELSQQRRGLPWESGWIPNNPASKLKPPKTMPPPTVPFTAEEVRRILAFCEPGGDRQKKTQSKNVHRLRALVLLLLYSGLRIRDAATLCRDRIADCKLLLYTAKTGVPVFCPLLQFVVAELESVRGTSAQFFFWSGEGKPKSCVGDWQRSSKKPFRSASIPDGHAHRFRHTFATNLLLAGMPLDRVATLLGHTNSKVTEKHYAPWIRARQEQLEADVWRVWEQNPVSLLTTPSKSQLGTPVRVN